MRPFLPSSRAFLTASLAALAAIGLVAAIGEVLFGSAPSLALRISVIATVMGLVLLLAYAALPLMVRGFVEMMFLARLVRPASLMARRATTDRLILAAWALWTAVLLVVVPKLLLSGV